MTRSHPATSGESDGDTFQALARRKWPEARWVLGEGRYATVRGCGGTTVMLHQTERDAEQAMKAIHPGGSRGGCELRHSLVVLEDGAT